MRMTSFLAAGLLLAFAGHHATAGVPAALEAPFRETVRPFVATYCVECHSGKSPKGDVDLSVYTSVDAVARDLGRWEAILEQLQTGAMPPKKAKRQPTAEQRENVIAWARALRTQEAKRHAGDPGIVPARRLSNAEYDDTLRDLTGVDIRPAREFPVDPANEAGFDNSAESLAMSPALVKKYLEGARRVADHLVLKPQGFAFADHPVVADTDRDKYCVRRIIAVYKSQPTDLAAYFLAAWRYQHREALGQKGTLAEIAAQAGISPKYLAMVWSVLNEPAAEAGPIAALQALWRELPAPQPGTTDAPHAACERLRDFVVELRRKLTPEVKNLTVGGMNNGAQPLVLWKNDQFAANRRRYTGIPKDVKPEALTTGSDAARRLALPADPKPYEADFERFCAVFPDAFLVSERARVYLDPKQEKSNAGRLLSAGFHSMTGYYRDDRPLYDLILDDDGQRTLDRLWREFDFITGAPMRQYSSFLWFERTDSRFMRDPVFDFARAEDKDALSAAKIARLSEVYLEKARRNGGSDTALTAITDFFRTISASIRSVEDARRAAEPSHVAALQAFAERAYRRPLSGSERTQIAAFYRTLRTEDGLGHDDAVRDTLVRILMSPHFCYRVDLPGAGTSVAPLPDYALASRLSYFLWSSMPDETLLARAAAGELQRPDVLLSEAKRMLHDERARALAVEFGGNWLDFRRFEEHNSVDRGRFPAFNDALRTAMFEEPVRFFLDLAQRDGSIYEFLDAKHTFVNRVLARHYGMPEPDDWVRVDNADRYGRGGLLPMAVFLTRNSPGLRTSPVKRGYWVVRRLLGEHIPAPPANVPDLPDDEAKLGNLTLRDALARHRADQACAGCHARFDPLGLAFEGYGPIGEARTKDLGGRPVDTATTFPGGVEGSGLEGLRAYVEKQRRDEFVENLCRKLLAYGLGRSLIPSDDDTIETMRSRLAAEQGRFGVLIESVVASPQFRNKRVEAKEAE